MNINKILVGILAFVLVAGLGTPALADSLKVTESPPVVDLLQFANPSVVDPEDVVYENGNPDPSDGLAINFGVIANDFELEDNLPITDLHFIFIDNLEPFGWDGPFQYQIRQDDGGNIGGVIAEGVGQNVQTEQIEDGPFGPRFIVWLDFEEPIALSGGVKYWLVLHAGTSFDDETDHGMFWEKSDIVIGDDNWGRFTNDPNGWFKQGFDTWFQLTSKQKVVGGELLSIDSTALLLASAQSTSWMIPLVLSALGIGLFVVSRKPENS